MKLRKRTRGQLAAAAAARADAAAAALAEQAPSQEPDASQDEDCSLQTRPDLVDAVIRTLGRVDVFPTASLKALRLTCQAFRDLVDSTGVFSTVKFAIQRSYELETLRAWSRSARWMLRTCSVLIEGHMPRKLPVPLLDSIATHRPPLSKLKLDGVGEAGEVLLAAPMELLRELAVKCATKKPAVIEGRLRNTSLSGLRSLRLENVTADASQLATVLARLSELQSLELFDFDIKGRVSQPPILDESSLSRLETLKLGASRNVDAIGLLSAPALPALRTLELRCFDQTTLEVRPWLGKLTSLILNHNCISGLTVGAALRGGPLEKLNMVLDFRNFSNTWDWGAMELPHLTRLDLFCFDIDALADVARAKMPALRTAVLPFTEHTTTAGVRAFNAAFPSLRHLELKNPTPFVEQNAGAMAVVGSEVVPKLETFKLGVSINTAAEITQGFLPNGPAGATLVPAWPNMRALDLEIEILIDIINVFDERQMEIFAAVARAASHCPGLISLNMSFGGGLLGQVGASPEALGAFVDAAKEVKAWPNLRSVWVVALPEEAEEFVAENIHEMWPDVAVAKWEMEAVVEDEG